MERLKGVWIPPVVTNNSPSTVPEGGAPFLVETEMALGKLEPYAQEFFGKLFETPEFEFGLLKLRKFLQPFPAETASFASPEIRMEFDKLGGLLAGLFFECIAHDFLNGSIETNQRLLSPRQTSELYRRLFWKRTDQFDEHGGFGLSIPGLTVPDGILFNVVDRSRSGEQLIIRFVCEYALSIRFSRKLSQAEYYTSANSAKDLYHFSIFRDPQPLVLYKRLNRAIGIPPKQRILFSPKEYQGAIYVLPKPNDEQEKQSVIEKLRGVRDVVFAPFTGREFRKVLTAIIDGVAREV